MSYAAEAFPHIIAQSYRLTQLLLVVLIVQNDCYWRGKSISFRAIDVRRNFLRIMG